MSIVSGKGNVWGKDNETSEWITMTNVEDEALNPAAMALQQGSYMITNASQVTSDGTHGSTSHHDDNSSATAALIISTTVLLGLLIAGSIYMIYKYKVRTIKRRGSYENIVTTEATNSNELEPPADV